MQNEYWTDKYKESEILALFLEMHEKTKHILLYSLTPFFRSGYGDFNSSVKEELQLVHWTGVSTLMALLISFSKFKEFLLISWDAETTSMIGHHLFQYEVK